jgi:hypothetical protein
MANFGVFTFQSIEAIQELEGFRSENPISIGTYRRVIGDYELPEEIKCFQLKKNGHLCLHNHKHGYVIELQDNSISVIGNTCVKGYAETTRLKADINFYQNQKRRQIQQEYLQTLLETVEPQLQQLKAIGDAVITESKVVKELRTEMTSIIQRVDDMNRNQRWSVQIWAKRDNGKDEEGNKIYKRFLDSLGSLKGATYLNPSRYTSLYKNIMAIFSAYEIAEDRSKNGTLSELSKKYLSSLTSQLNECVRLNDDYQSIAADREEFFHLQNLQLLCYLTDDISTRLKLAKLVLSCTGRNNVSRPQAKSWLSEMDTSYQNKLKAIKVYAA